ncbi:enoyl-CoA hydratase [Paenibacillus sp. JCM 10914]|nr:enoyl-CoA hydratase [Paenibacillus sp. JCM 10914]
MNYLLIFLLEVITNMDARLLICDYSYHFQQFSTSTAGD